MVLFTLTWMLLGLLLGASAFFIAGLVAALILGDDSRDSIGRWYVSMAASAYENFAVYAQQTGGLSVTRVKSAPKMSGDRATIDGVLGHWRDPLEVKSTLAGKDFGLALQSTTAYITPLLGELGKFGGKAFHSGDLGSTVDHEGDGDAEERVHLDFEIPERPQILDLRSAATALPGSCLRRWGSLAYKWGELSQEKFHNKVSMKVTIMLMASFATGVGLALAVSKFGGGGGGGTTIPIMVQGVMV